MMDGNDNSAYHSTGTGSRGDGLHTISLKVNGDPVHPRMRPDNNGNATAVVVDVPEKPVSAAADKDAAGEPKRDAWGSDIEFLMSCIALSVGLGNVWRFPFAALENGGGAFLIPYLVVLLLVGKPIYYLEMLVGQFSGRGSVNVYDVVPLMRGIGYGQLFAVGALLSYYAALLALTVRYFVASFSSVLPWSECLDEWGDTCIDSTSKHTGVTLANASVTYTTSAEFYFYKTVLNEKDSINDGLGGLDFKLVLCLAFSWIGIGLLLMRGIQSTGKASYFLALFPYATMAILFVRAVTLPGAMKGIMYFLTPQWGELLNPNVWFAAVSQCFFSIAVCFSLIVMYSSYNRFDQKIYKDTFILTSLDTFTSLIAGIIIFGILGNLAHETGTDDIRAVVKGGTGVAFVSYPDAISKMEFIPQLFAATFFFMLFVLAIGSNVGLSVCLMTAIRDKFRKLSHARVAIGIALVQFIIGLLYTSEGGQFLLNMVDYFGVSMVVYVLAIAELLTFGWIYGVSRICKDAEFMLGIKTSWYWRICWGIVSPAMMIAILIYQIVKYEPLKYNGVEYPPIYHVIGWVMSAFGILQLPIWGAVAVYQQEGKTLWEKFAGALRPSTNWGPLDPVTNERYHQFLSDRAAADGDRSERRWWHRLSDNIFN